MNYIKQLTHFFNKATADPHLRPTHLSLFMALFQLWNQSRFAPHIQIIRDEVMRLAKINSKATYHKTIGYLHRHHYIDYQPSYNPYKGSKIEFFPNPGPPKNEPVQNLSTRSLNEPYNKLYTTNIKKDNISNLTIESQKKEDQLMNRIESQQMEKNIKEKNSAKKEIPPPPEAVERFFLSRESTIREAHRFINHYTANGWLVGGKSPMKNWKASANNWITNSINFNRHANRKNTDTNRARHLSAQNRKNYFEPL